MQNAHSLLPKDGSPLAHISEVALGVLLTERGDEHETCKIPDGRDVHQLVSHVRRVKANLTPAPIRHVPAQWSIH